MTTFPTAERKRTSFAADDTVLPRKQPSQRRARERVNRILEATGRLLLKNAYGAVSTNHIAREADIPVASIYQYFPNKQSIFYALAQRYLKNVEEMFAELSGMGEDWAPSMAWLAEQLVCNCQQNPGLPRLLHVLNDLPELRSLKEEHDNYCARILQQFVEQCGMDAEREDTALVARLLVDGFQALGMRVMRMDTAGGIRAGEYFAQMTAGLMRA